MAALLCVYLTAKRVASAMHSGLVARSSSSASTVIAAGYSFCSFLAGGTSQAAIFLWVSLDIRLQELVCEQVTDSLRSCSGASAQPADVRIQKCQRIAIEGAKAGVSDSSLSERLDLLLKEPRNCRQKAQSIHCDALRCP